MSCLLTNLPTMKVWVRKEYLRDLKDGHGEFVEGIWVAAKSIPGRAYYFETYLPEYGAIFDKLPISAFVSSPNTPTPDLDLPNLQFWNCMDYNVTTIVKSIVASDFKKQTIRNTITIVFSVVLLLKDAWRYTKIISFIRSLKILCRYFVKSLKYHIRM